MTVRRPLRIVHTEASLGWGGQEIRLLTEARRFAEEGHEVRLVCDVDSEIYRAAPRYGIETTPTHLKRKTISSLQAIRRFFADWQPDVVNSHSSVDHWLSALARVGLTKPPAIVRTRHISAPVSRDFFTRWLYAKGCEFVMTTSKAIVADLTADGFLAIEHVAAVPTGIDTDAFSPGDCHSARQALDLPGNAFIFGIVATLRSWKGHSYLLDAFADAENRETLLVIVGDGPQEENLTAQIRSLGVQESVRMVGRQENVVPFLQAMNVFVLPSYANEGVPQALLQAMACELPIIACPVGGIPELVEGLEGVQCVPQKDAEALSNAMNRAMTDHVDAALRKALRERVIDQYSLQNMYDRVVGVFETAIKRNM